MKLILVNQRYGHTRTIVIRGWMKGLLSLCLLGAPVALGYLGYQVALADNNALVSQETKLTPDEIISSEAHAELAVYEAAFAENSAGSHGSTENFHKALAIAASVVSPQVLQPEYLSVKYQADALAVFAHGRLVDPAVYFRHTLH